MSSLTAILEESPFGSLGVSIAALLILSIWVLLPRRERNWVRAPLALLFLHLVSVFILSFLSVRSIVRPYLSYVSLFMLLASIGRSGFLLVMHSVMSRGIMRPLPRIFRDLLQALVYIVAILITLRAAGVAPGSLLTTSALLTAVIGLSLQDTLGNMFAGLAIQAQRPFDVGDWIQFDDNQKHVGRVMEINWRATKVMTLDQIEVTVPNARLAKAPISNYTKPTTVTRRNVSVLASYETSPHRVKDAILSAVSDIPGVLRDPGPSVILSEFGERGAEYRLRYFTSDYPSREYLDATVRERIWYAFHRANVRIPIPVNDPAPLHEREREAARREKALRYVDFLEALPEEARQRLAALSETRLYGPGEVVLRQGDKGEELFIIWHGEVAVMFNRAGEGDVEIARLGPGKFVGEMSLMTGEHRTATVKATEPSEMIVVGKAAFQEILEDMPELAQRISDFLAARREELGEMAALADQNARISHHEKSGILLARIKEFFSI